MPRLYARIYLHLLGVLVAVGIATSLVFALGSRGPFSREPGQRLVRHATSLVTEDLGRPEALERRLRQLHRDLEVDLRVSDAEGREISRAGGEVPALTPEEAARVRGGEVVFRPRRRLLVAAPLRDPVSGALVGTLEASGRPGFEPNLFRPLAVVGLLLGLVALAAVPLARRISRPIERLTDAARRLGAGDLSARVPVGPRRRRWPRPHRDEIQELTGTFNDMAQRVEGLVSGQKELLANVSHELRSPLARIRLALELLPRTAESEGRLRDLEADLGELNRLIEDVLTASRLDVTVLPPHPGPVEIGALLAEVAERARRDPLTASQTIEVDGPAGLTIVADAALLRRALWNLVENAAKYGAPPITLGAERRGNRTLLSVSDMGPGIPRAERERVLEPFYRIDKVRTPGPPGGTAGGFGLGLALARRIAEVHQGSIAIEPRWEEHGRERGCRVMISLPTAPDATA
jgi:two-component system OmpR family sensor kinase